MATPLLSPMFLSFIVECLTCNYSGEGEFAGTLVCILCYKDLNQSWTTLKQLARSQKGFITSSPKARGKEHSPGLSQKIKVPKKRYSYADPLERMDTPKFDKTETSQAKKGPSSAATVLTMAGLFVVAILLMMSGIIVLIAHTETPFIITGCLFLGVGFAMLLVCGVLQRKNVIKYVLDLDRDLYFLNINKSYMWKVMFENRSALPLSE